MSLSAGLQAVEAQPAAPPTTQSAAVPADSALANLVRTMLAQGQVVEAMQTTDQQLRAAPKDPVVRAVYAELRMSLAHQAIAAQRFSQAEQLLKQVVAAQPDHPSAGKMIKVIEDARGGVDQALNDAEQLIRLERFEQAAGLLAQVAGLIPDQPQRWKSSWLIAAVGAGDDHYILHNYEAALPFYTQAIELGGGEGPGSDALLWRWSHCYAMNLARTADLRRSAKQWSLIIEQAKDHFAAAHADILGHFIVGLGRYNLGEFAESADALREVVVGPGGGEGGDGRALTPGEIAQRQALALRTKAIVQVDGMNRANLIDRRTGAWAIVLPGDPAVRRGPGVIVTAPSDLIARRVAEAIAYHAPRLAAYLGGGEADLKWTVDYSVIVQASPDASLGDGSINSYTRIRSSLEHVLLKHETVCSQSDPLLIGATVPHELTHVLISRLAGYPPVPLAIDEGLAIHAETTARYLMFRRSLVESGGATMTVGQLLAANSLPPIGQRARFYGECYNLVAWLLTRGKPAKVIDLCRRTSSVSPVDALLKTYEFPDLATAEKAYRTFLVDQGLVRNLVP